MWTIKRIDEADFGCEERLPGEPLMVLVSLECDDGRMLQLEVADNWLTMQELDEGDEWPDDPDERMKKMRKAQSRCSGWRVIWMLWRSWNKNIDKPHIISDIGGFCASGITFCHIL